MAFFKPSKFESPSKGIVLFESLRNEHPENKWAKLILLLILMMKQVNYGNPLLLA
jgi:hypothetical protein